MGAGQPHLLPRLQRGLALARRPAGGRRVVAACACRSEDGRCGRSSYARSPDSPCVTQPGKLAVVDDRPGASVVSWTYAQLEAEANRLANLLASLGVGPGEKVIWCGPNSPQVVGVVNATRKLGAVAVPLNYRLTPVEARYIVTHSDACAAYVDAEYAHLIPVPHVSRRPPA